MKNRAWCMFGGLAVLCCFLGWAAAPATGLHISPRDSSRLLLCLSLRPGESFSIRFTHSVARRPVEETLYLREDGCLVLDRTVWDMGGAGLPCGPEPGMRFELADGKFILTEMQRVFPEVVLAVGTVANHHLVCRDRQLALDKLVSPGEAIRLFARKSPRWLFWWSEWKWRALSDRLR